MGRNYIYISVGWISVATIFACICFCSLGGEKIREKTKQVAMQEGYEETRVDGTWNYVYKKKDN